MNYDYRQGDLLTSHRSSRRDFVLSSAMMAGGGAMALLLTGRRADPVLAQDATPASESLLGALGYPEVRIRITETGFDVTPTSFPAGRILLTIENASGQEASADLFGPPEGTSMADFQAQIEATPPPMAAGATPVAEEEGFPSWLYEARLTGGAIVQPNQTASVVVEVAPGDWAVGGEGNQTPAFVTATGEATAAAGTEPSADVTVTMQDFAFAGLPQQVPAGPQIWKVTNAGPSIHMMVLSSVPSEITLQQILDTFSALAQGGTPGPGAPIQESDFGPSMGQEISSVGQTTWVELDLAPGNYFVACFVPDQATGMPHVLMGMAAIVTAGTGATSSPAAGSSSTAAGTAEGTAVTIQNFAFDPATLAVPVGATVTWTNKDTAPHTVTADDGGFDSGRLDPGQSFSQSFDTAGSVAYHCSFHPNMHGTITVS